MLKYPNRCYYRLWDSIIYRSCSTSLPEMATIFVKLYLKTISHRPDVYILSAKSHVSRPSTLRQAKRCELVYIVNVFYKYFCVPGTVGNVLSLEKYRL